MLLFKILMDLTPLARNTLIIITLFSAYAYFGLFEHTVLTGIILLSVSLRLGYNSSVAKDEDLDVLGAMCINDRGYFNPSGTVKPPNTQNCVAYFEKSLDWENDAKPYLISKLIDYRRFCSMGVIRKGSKKVWNTQWIKVNMNDPDIVNEIFQSCKVSNNSELYKKINDLCDIKLEPYLPQWRMYYIENSNGLSCWLWRVSHGIADGLRLIALISDIFQDIDGNPADMPLSGKLSSSTDISIANLSREKFEGLTLSEAKMFYESGIVKRRYRRRSSVADSTMSSASGSTTVSSSSSSSSTSSGSNKKSKKRRKTGLASIKSMWKLFNPIKLIRDLANVNDLLNGPLDTLSPFKPDDTVHCPNELNIFRPRMTKSSITGELRDYIMLDYVKKIKNHYKVSVNDVLTALFAGAVHTYILSQKPDYFNKQDISEYKTNAIMAFGFPPKEPFAKQYDWLKNGFTFVSWPIPVEIESFEERLRVCHKNGKKKKQSLEALMSMGISDLGARLGLDYVLEDGTTNMFKRHSCVFSNVPGPPNPVYFRGTRVVRFEGSYYNVIPQVILMSYDGKIFLTVACDGKRFPGIQLLCDVMVEECEKEYSRLD